MAGVARPSRGQCSPEELPLESVAPGSRSGRPSRGAPRATRAATFDCDRKLKGGRLNGTLPRTSREVHGGWHGPRWRTRERRVAPGWPAAAAALSRRSSGRGRVHRQQPRRIAGGARERGRLLPGCPGSRASRHAHPDQPGVGGHRRRRTPAARLGPGHDPRHHRARQDQRGRRLPRRPPVRRPEHLHRGRPRRHAAGRHGQRGTARRRGGPGRGRVGDRKVPARRVGRDGRPPHRHRALDSGTAGIPTRIRPARARRR